MTLANLPSLAAQAFAHPIAIIAVIVVSLLWARSRWQNNNLTLILSILALTFTQLVLLEGEKNDAAVQAKLDEIVRALPAARDGLIRAEERSAEDIERLRL